MYIVDYREAELIRQLEAQSEEKVSLHNLPVGDIWIGTEEQGIVEGGLVIERKTLADLEASVLDGRYREQKGRILTFCQEKKAQPIYLLEGGWSSATGRLQKKALMKLANRMIFHYHIPIYCTANTKETAEWILSVMEQWKEDSTQFQRRSDEIKVSDGIHVQKKANQSDPSMFLISCLTQCSGVSPKIAEAILQTYPSLSHLLSASVKEIQEIKVGARRVGPAVATRLHQLLHSCLVISDTPSST